MSLKIRKTVTVALMLATGLLVAGCEPDTGLYDDVTGTWTGSALLPGSTDPVPATMDLLQDGSQLTGTLEGDISIAGTITGDTVLVRGDTVIGRDFTSWTLSATVDGDVMDGSVTVDIDGVGTAQGPATLMRD